MSKNDKQHSKSTPSDPSEDVNQTKRKRTQEPKDQDNVSKKQKREKPDRILRSSRTPTDPSDQGADAKRTSPVQEQEERSGRKRKDKGRSKDKEKDEPEKPRLTSPELEFDWDRSQLRDPRPTPGRVRRPRYEDFDIPNDLKTSLLERFQVSKPEKPKGRLSATQKDELFVQGALLDPMHSFHDLNICFRKGPNGSPTYDSAGFQLDCEKVEDWKCHRAYNKSRIVNGMESILEDDARQEKQMTEIFFKPGSVSDSYEMLDYVKDQISKDLNIPWHRIGIKEAELWANKGYAKRDMQEWLHVPNEEERKRMHKLQGGCVLRKHI